MPLSTLSAGTGRETGQLVGKGRAQTGGLATFREQYRYSSPTFDVTTSDGKRPDGGISRRPEQSPQCPEIAASAKLLDRRQAGSQGTFRPASDRRSTMATWVRTRAGERSPRRPRQRRVRPWRGSAPEGLRPVPRGAPATRLAPRPLVGWPPPVLGWPGLAGVATRHRACHRCRGTGPAPRKQTRAGCRHQILDERARVTAAEGPVCRLAGGPGGGRPFSEPAGVGLTA